MEQEILHILQEINPYMEIETDTKLLEEEILDSMEILLLISELEDKYQIQYYRRAKGMTQAELAEAVHISRTHMSNIEAPNTKTSISLNLLFDIAEALDIPVKELFDFQGRSL